MYRPKAAIEQLLEADRSAARTATDSAAAESGLPAEAALAGVEGGHRGVEGDAVESHPVVVPVDLQQSAKASGFIVKIGQRSRERELFQPDW